ncbi:uncharacterized protein BDR25DRAFT_361320 [Lindgomyces ingoldianus]|uniref:Uncharacterized protein n=1 Tax=Lindgomyces ingoldianus TaxID=673940 RepID=A0ACB6QDU9_9PLEO|nr:uncharacterized protein BDR25DRAFT_361320 [Lindgomyces ingoldianus]KAF2464783.1 hypothetical protein BDR25DRAFT_361320 [Lindgomyces ingoldianus]
MLCSFSSLACATSSALLEHADRNKIRQAKHPIYCQKRGSMIMAKALLWMRPLTMSIINIFRTLRMKILTWPLLQFCNEVGALPAKPILYDFPHCTKSMIYI